MKPTALTDVDLEAAITRMVHKGATERDVRMLRQAYRDAQRYERREDEAAAADESEDEE
jgi:hypothetical protein